MLNIFGRNRLGRPKQASGSEQLSAPTVLTACTDVFGSVEVLEQPPALEEIADAIYLPWSATGQWGLFDPSGFIVDNAVDYRGLEKIAKRPIYDINPSKLNYNSEENFIYGGTLNHHFGHFITDVLSRLWVKSVFPKTRILFHSMCGVESSLKIPFISTLFSALGVAPEDIVVLDRPTRIRKLILPAPSLREHAYVHRAFGDMCHDLGTRLSRGSKFQAGKVLYLSKSQLSAGISGVANELDLERELRRQGAEIIYPEQLPLQDQIGIFSGDRVVIASTGSALHLSAFASAARVIGLNRDNQVVSTFKCLDLLQRVDARYVYCSDGFTLPADGRFQLPFLVPNPAKVAEELNSLATS